MRRGGDGTAGTVEQPASQIPIRLSGRSARIELTDDVLVTLVGFVGRVYLPLSRFTSGFLSGGGLVSHLRLVAAESRLLTRQLDAVSLVCEPPGNGTTQCRGQHVRPGDLEERMFCGLFLGFVGSCFVALFCCLCLVFWV